MNTFQNINNKKINLLNDNGSYGRKLSNIFDELPENIQDAIMSVNSSDAITEISEKYKLHIDQQASLGSETGLVLLGLTDPMEFVNNLSSKLGIDKNIASQIVGEINEKIFVKVKDSLRAIHSGQKNSGPATVQQKAPDLMKSVEAEKLNVPKPAMDVLQGKVLEQKKRDTSILGFSPKIQNDELGIKNNESTEKKLNQEQRPMGEMNILEEKMRTGFSVAGEETEKEERKTMGKVVDPFRETI